MLFLKVLIMKDYKTKEVNKIIDYKNDVIPTLIDLKADIDMGNLTEELRNEKISLFNSLAKDAGVLPY